MYPYVHKGSEGRHIRHYTRQFHSRPEVLDAVYIFGECEFRRFGARVASRFRKFAYYVVKRREAETALHVFFRLDAAAEFRIAHQGGAVHAQVRGHAVHDMVALGMDGGVVERIRRTRDAQEAGALLIGLGSESLDLKQLLP